MIIVDSYLLIEAAIKYGEASADRKPVIDSAAANSWIDTHND